LEEEGEERERLQVSQRTVEWPAKVLLRELSDRPSYCALIKGNVWDKYGFQHLNAQNEYKYRSDPDQQFGSVVIHGDLFNKIFSRMSFGSAGD
jgi:hypothetical protein